MASGEESSHVQVQTLASRYLGAAVFDLSSAAVQMPGTGNESKL